MWTSSQVQKDIRITHLNQWQKNLINKYIHYKSNVLSTFSWLEPVLTPVLDMGIAKSGSNLVHSAPSHILRLTPCVKARKSFHGVLSCLVMMCHQTNLDCKSFSISEDLVKRLWLWPWTSQNDISEWYSGWWWCITILSFTDQRHCPGKHSLKFRTFTVTLTLNTAKQPFHKTLQLRMLWTCTVKLSWSQKNQFRIYNRNSNDFTVWTQIQLLCPRPWRQKPIFCTRHSGL